MITAACLPFELTDHMTKRERVNCPVLAKIHADKARADAVVAKRRALNAAIVEVEIAAHFRRLANERLDQAEAARARAMSELKQAEKEMADG